MKYIEYIEEMTVCPYKVKGITFARNNYKKFVNCLNKIKDLYGTLMELLTFHERQFNF